MGDNTLKSGLGVASLVLGIVGFLTGLLVIGLLFDVLAIFLGIICIISKKQKSSFGVAGLVLGILGIVLTMFVHELIDDAADASAKSVITSQSEKASSAEDIAEQLDIKEYSFHPFEGDSEYVLKITNNSPVNASISANGIAMDDSGKKLGADSQDAYSVAPNDTIFFSFYFSGIYTDNFSYEIVADKTYIDYVKADVTYEVEKNADNVIITVTNSSDTPTCTIVYALFLKDGVAVGYDYSYVGDMSIPANTTLTCQLSSFAEYDDVDIVVNSSK